MLIAIIIITTIIIIAGNLMISENRQLLFIQYSNWVFQV